jgi:hypothetical protein
MSPLLLRLPFELRHQIWNLILEPNEIEPCKYPSKFVTGAFSHAAGNCERFNVYEAIDNRLLRVCRQIHEEVRPLLKPKRFIVCNGLCLETFFLGIKDKDRRWVKNVRVNVYVGDSTEAALEGHTGLEFLRKAEASCGGFVQSALKCRGVRSVINVATVGVIDEDSAGRRLLCMDLALK